MIRNILTSQWIQQLSSAVLCPLKFQIFLQRCNFKQISYDLLTQIFWNFPPLPTVSKEPIFPFPTELKRLAEKKLVAISNMIRLLLARKQSSNKFVEIRRNLFLTFRKFTKIDPCVLSSFFSRCNFHRVESPISFHTSFLPCIREFFAYYFT